MTFKRRLKSHLKATRQLSGGLIFYPCPFYRAASNAGRSSREKGVLLSVRPSVCLSAKRVDCDYTEEKSIQIFIP